MKHTPGPWRAVLERGEYQIIRSHNLIATTHVYEDEGKHNAHLISAAPEMLKALELLLDDDRLMNAMKREQAESILMAVVKAKGGMR